MVIEKSRRLLPNPNFLPDSFSCFRLSKGDTFDVFQERQHLAWRRQKVSNGNRRAKIDASMNRGQPTKTRQLRWEKKGHPFRFARKLLLQFEINGLNCGNCRKNIFLQSDLLSRFDSTPNSDPAIFYKQFCAFSATKFLVQARRRRSCISRERLDKEVTCSRQFQLQSYSAVLLLRLSVARCSWH